MNSICSVRNYKLDNIKVILIFFVIFGHLLETVGGDNLYKIIYSFHMPVFIFISGWFAPSKCVSKKTMFKLIHPYILFQLLYILFNVFAVNEGNIELSIQFSTPYWLLWYLLTLTFYYLLIPIIATEKTRCAIGILIRNNNFGNSGRI